MEKINLSFVFRFIIILLAVINIEIRATDPIPNIISSFSRTTRLDNWQIAEDIVPESALSSLQDTIWQLFKPGPDDNTYTEGNWLIRISIVIKDTLSSKEVLGLFPINIVTAYEIYWDGAKIASNGIIGANKADQKAGKYNFKLALSPDLVTPGKHILIFRISNHDNYSSWKWFHGDIIIGRYDSLLIKIFQLHYVAFFTAGILFIPFLINLFLYIARQRKIEHLIFSLICFIVILDSVTSLVPVLADIPTTFVHLELFTYQIITILFTVLFPTFFIYLFVLPKKTIWVIIIINLIIFIFFTNIWNVFNIMSVTVLIISSIITIWALIKGREESLIIFMGLIVAWIAYYFNFAFNGLAATMVICTSFSISRQFARKEKAEKEAQLKSAHLENELLKRNINPHFVLNALTSIIVWLRKDSNSAIKLIEALAEEFRMINQISALKQIPINQEIDLCKAHLKIMSYRKGAEFKMETMNIDEGDTVPPMVFHTLVENGLTHGYENKIAGTFRLQTIKKSHSIKYILTNDGDFNLEDTKGSSGFGAKYIKGRLEESYPNRWNFTSNKTVEGWESIIEIRNN